MSGICGWAGFETTREDGQRLIDRMGSALAQFDGSVPSVHAEHGYAVGCSGQGQAAQMYLDRDLLVALSGKVNVDRGKSPSASPQGNAASAIAEAFRKLGADCLAAITGAFVLVVIDKRKGETLLAIDRMGIEPLSYCVVGQTLVFASTADAIKLHPAIEARIDPQSLYNYVYFHVIPGPGTIFSGQRRLLPGHYVRFRNGEATTHAYWEMRFDEDHRRPFPELREEFLSLLRSAVRNAAADPETGAFLSGGTDSSTLAGMLGEVSGSPARTYSIGFAAEGYDEMAYARIAARHFGTRHHEYYVTPDDVADAIPRIATVHDQPFGNASAVPTYYCARLAKSDGIVTLLGGDGGDELFGGNVRYAEQYIFSLYDRVPSVLRKALVEPIVFGFPGGHKLFVVRKARSYINKALTPMPARLESYNLVEHFGPANIFTADFMRGVDTAQPMMLLNRTYHGAHAGTLINRMLALDLKFTLADNDLPKVSRTCELARIGVQYPMLDDALVAFSARLEPHLKLRGTRLRYFFKEALRGFLPDEIIAKTKHGFGLPFGLWLRENRRLRDLVNSSLNDHKKRGIVRPEFIDQLIGTHLADHPAYYGTMAWVLMMLEQWFQQHGARA